MRLPYPKGVVLARTDALCSAIAQQAPAMIVAR